MFKKIVGYTCFAFSISKIKMRFDGKILFVPNSPPSIPLDRNNNQTHELFGEFFNWISMFSPIPPNFHGKIEVALEGNKRDEFNNCW